MTKAPEAIVLTPEQAQAEMLKEAREQTQLLRRINSVIQLWGVLLIIGLGLACLWVLFGGLITGLLP